ncbi:transcriptional attenuator, LytR family [Blastococcus haudaquaticus]|uniref:Transcriptional attenuator, LytR family n=1 Tax=Blastococcus haudaquaticus TaxID=1938745 RepID=A0A286GI60_9ACTN|nr:transcriptional attenuator, LytR family [Blastococcus haudaquaticus]
MSSYPFRADRECRSGALAAAAVRSWSHDQAARIDGRRVSAGPGTPGDDLFDGAGVRRAPGSRHRRDRGFGPALGLSVLGAVLPGTAFLAAGRRVLGAVTLVVFLLLVGGGVWLATGGRRAALRAAVDTDRLLWIVGSVALLALLWVVVIVAGYRMLLPRRPSRGQHVVGALVVTLLVVAVVAPAVLVGRLAATQRDLIAGVFDDDGRSATVEDTPDPFGDQERVNVLLLGGDGGEGRDGVRTDTVIVASIATETGETTLFSLPRNLEDLPFPADSPLAAIYPDGFESGNESESLLNAVYRNGPADHPDVLGPTDDPGADFLKLGVGEALGLDIDYYVLVNLDGFSSLVDALGGITVNVNYFVPVGGDPGTGSLPDAYIAPGPDQELDGATALAFARGRFGLTDYDRMDRQRCTIDAIIAAADPVTLLRSYQDLAATTQDIVRTDIPRSALDDFVDLGFLVKDAGVRSVVFDPSLISPAYPDYDLMRQIVQQSIAPADVPVDAPGDDAPAEGTPAGTPAAPSTSAAPPAPSGGPAADVSDACAYDPVRAQEALAQGQPPTRGG